MPDRAALLERYQALPLPDASMEAWRFTDLSDFDPDSFAVPNGQVPVTVPWDSHSAMLEIDAAAVASVGEGGVQVGQVPEGVTFEALTDEVQPVVPVDTEARERAAVDAQERRGHSSISSCSGSIAASTAASSSSDSPRSRAASQAVRRDLTERRTRSPSGDTRRPIRRRV